MLERKCEPLARTSFHFEAATLPTKNVIVYADRAEVKRVVTVSLAKGTSEIFIENVSAVIERQSVRVDGRGALIQEVQYQEMPIDTEQETEKMRALEREKMSLESLRFTVEDEMNSIRKQIEVLDGVAGQIAAGTPRLPSPTTESLPNVTRRHTVDGTTALLGSGQGTVSIEFLTNDDALNNLAKFLTYYGEKVAEMKTQLRCKQREWDQLTEQMESLERQIDQLRCGYEYDSLKRSIMIVVEMEAAAVVELFVTYQVYCASWHPAYDIRALTTAEGDQNSSIKLCYYGLVEQNTGDDWIDTDMVLSTSSPSIGGCAPQLATLSATIHRANKSQRQRHASAARRKSLYTPSEEDMGFGSFEYNEMADAVALHRYNTVQLSRSSDENSCSAPSVENLISTCFSIPRAVSVPSNGVEHKVLVGMFDLTCSFTHECVPSRCPSAFLSAVITNTTPFPFPPGDAAVYVNNGFVAKAHLRLVQPGEEFRCSLGIDPSIKVEYKTPIVGHELVGFMSKSTIMTHEQVISLRNAKVMQTVQVIVREQIPKSTDEKIKVLLLYQYPRPSSPTKRSKMERQCILKMRTSKFATSGALIRIARLVKVEQLKTDHIALGELQLNYCNVEVVEDKMGAFSHAKLPAAEPRTEEDLQCLYPDHDALIMIRGHTLIVEKQFSVITRISCHVVLFSSVSVLSPDVRLKNGEAKLNKDHNLEWTIVLAPGQQRNLQIKYTVEHPASESVSFKLAVP